jgi:hypothetical protein
MKAILLAFTLPALLLAKGATVKIMIEGEGLPSPISITDPKTGEFPVWSGPGVRRNGSEETEGFIIEWSRGRIEEPSPSLRRYRVSFYAGCRQGEIGCKFIEPTLVYVVPFAYDPATEQGFVYLPGRGDEMFGFNSSSMFHGRGWEGNWFRATRAWETFIKPFLAKASAVR